MADANTPTMAVPGVTDPVPYHERWVTLLPGGFDPQYLRGRGVHMVDVWTGKEVFDFSYPTGTIAAGDPRAALRYPVAATPAMVMWGKSERRPSLSFENDGYFDTATFGDTGGQLWVLRFNNPGAMDGAGRVQDWYGARIFEMGNSPSGSFCNRSGGQPFFYITANTALPGSHVFRVYAGTGDRFNLLDTNGGICGPDNLRACAQKGCSVTLATASNAYAATGQGSDGRGLTQSACSSSAQGDFVLGSDATGSVPTCGVQNDAHVSVAGCPDVVSGNASFTKDVAVTCEPDFDGDYACSVGTSSNRGTGVATYGTELDLSTDNSTWSTRPQSRNWYFSLRVFDDTGNRTLFRTPAGAAAYDGSRYWLWDSISSPNPYGGSWSWSGGFVWIDGASNTPGSLATSTSPGWAMFYRHSPTVTTEGHTYNVNMLDERTSSVSGLYGKVLWNTLQPAIGEATSTSTCKPSKCTAAFRRLSYHYGADAVTGAPVLFDSSGNPLRSIVQNTLVPAQGDQPTVFVNQKGQIAVGLTAVNPEKGASNLGMGGAMDPVMGLGAVEVNRDLHGCRHFKAADPNGVLTAAERAAITAKCK
jgi:type IV pilus assembly protein PilY1